MRCMTERVFKRIRESSDIIHRQHRPLGRHAKIGQMIHSLFATADQKEGMAAFLAKRKPAFVQR